MDEFEIRNSIRGMSLGGTAYVCLRQYVLAPISQSGVTIALVPRFLPQPLERARCVLVAPRPLVPVPCCCKVKIMSTPCNTAAANLNFSLYFSLKQHSPAHSHRARLHNLHRTPTSSSKCVIVVSSKGAPLCGPPEVYSVRPIERMISERLAPID